KIHASLALAPVDPNQRDFLYESLLDAEAPQVLVIRDALSPHKKELVEKLWAVARQTGKEKDGRRLRAAAALASFDPQSGRWEDIAGALAEQLVAENPIFLGIWMEALRPAKAPLIEALGMIFRERRDERTAERNLATIILSDYAADLPPALADLL